MLRLLGVLITSLLLVAADSRAQEAPTGHFDHAVLISVDGLRSDALEALPQAELPAFSRLRRGSSTLNARTDPNATVTLPNHTGMITGRLLEGPQGHGWEFNSYSGRTSLHEHRGDFIAGIFNVAHEHHVSTGLFVSKQKFLVYVATYGMTGGTYEYRDETHDGAIDAFHFPGDMRSLEDGRIDEVTDAAIKQLQSADRTLTFIHYGQTDMAGHATGWDLTPDSNYLNSVRLVDREIAELFAAIDADEELARSTAIVLTTDHGGGAPFKSHGEMGMWCNYIIPLLVWLGDDAPTAELYELNPEVRIEPGIKQIGWMIDKQPVRNADSGNLALDLLGLPAIPGSTANAVQDLKVALPERMKLKESAGRGGTSRAP